MEKLKSVLESFAGQILHIGLFVATLVSVTLAGVQWVNKDPFQLENFQFGLPYGCALTLFLLAHEFGHYFAAKFHHVTTTYPYLVPAPPFLLAVNPFGTFGAIIKIKSEIRSKKALFDIGISGPLAGLVVCVGLLLWGFTHLPPKEYLLSIHPEYATLPAIPESGFRLGDSVLFYGLRIYFSTFGYVPPMTEIYHYPYLCAGWFGLFVTALNLMPIGQLDGGHVIYSLLGERLHKIVAATFFVLLTAVGLVSLILLIGWDIQVGSIGWLLWSILLFFVIKLKHPPVLDDSGLSNSRRILGWTTIILFMLIFPPIPFFES